MGFSGHGNKKLLEQQKAHAQQLLRHLKIHYKEEVNAINAGNTNNQKQIFVTIIKRKQRNPISRFADYRTNLEHDKQQLELVEPLMSPEEKTEHAALSANLEEISRTFNHSMTDDIQAEKIEARRIKKMEDDERRKKEKDELEIKNLQEQIASHRYMREKIDTMAQQNNAESLENSKFRANTSMMLAALSQKQDQCAHEIKVEMRKISENYFGRLAHMLEDATKKLTQSLESIKKLVTSVSQKQQNPEVVVVAAPPPYNPELAHPIPSAPPL